MQRTCTAEESMQSRSSISTHKVSHSGGGGHGWGGRAPYLMIFFETPSPHENQCPLGHLPPPSLINEAPHLKKNLPPLKHETTLTKNKSRFNRELTEKNNQK